MEYEVAHLADELASAHLCDIDNSTAASTRRTKKGTDYLACFACVLLLDVADELSVSFRRKLSKPSRHSCKRNSGCNWNSFFILVVPL